MAAKHTLIAVIQKLDRLQSMANNARSNIAKLEILEPADAEPHAYQLAKLDTALSTLREIRADYAKAYEAHL